MRAWECGYASDYWMTFKQAKSAGGNVRKGEKGSLVTFWKLYDTKDKHTSDDITVPVLRHYTAFNLEQIDGITIPDATVGDVTVEPFAPVEQAEAILNGYAGRPKIEHGGECAYYRA
ncbi:antirestriction protein ArdC [Rhodopirellula maiorica SM1]|uniref:Antirestriction protein ArdC n=2 Tax=Novipirellula TaxID=2795426 RepID=M5RNU6_9BACT|nr:antirestriction protein ArdC [Rhodopirellula maiorica SM1]